MTPQSYSVHSDVHRNTPLLGSVKEFLLPSPAILSQLPFSSLASFYIYQMNLAIVAISHLNSCQENLTEMYGYL